MSVILAVFKRNLVSYFSGVIGYLFVAVFLGASAYLAFSEQFFANNLANLDQLNLWFPALLVVLIPAITMSSWADERRFGTDELLFTLPATDLQILIGKYLAVLGVYSIALLFNAVGLSLALLVMGSPDWSLLLTVFIGFWFAGAALLAAGLVASAASKSPTVAYLLGLFVGGVPVMLYYGSTAFLGYSVAGNLRTFGLGILSFSGIVYFVSLIALFLFVNYVLITGRFWSTGPGRAALLVGLFVAMIALPEGLLLWLGLNSAASWAPLAIRVGVILVLALGLFLGTAIKGREIRSGLLFAVEFVALAITFVSVNQAANSYNMDVDLTSEKLYSLSSTTDTTLSSLKSDQEVIIRAFISPEVPKQFAPQRNTLLGLLRQYDSYNNVIVQISETRQFTPEATEAQRFGIDAQVREAEQAGRKVVLPFYLGVAITSGDSENVLPFFDLGTPVEYELTSAIYALTRPKRKTLGILKTDAKVTGGLDMSTFQQSPEWPIVAELKKLYDVKEVEPKDLANSDFATLLAFMPSTLTDQELPFLVAYVKSGHPTLIVDDPYPFWNPDLAPSSEKPRQGGMFGGGPPPTPKADGGRLTPLLDVLEVAWDSGRTVWDPYNPQVKLADVFRRFDAVFIDKNSGGSMPFGDKSPISNGLQQVLMLYPGQLQPRQGARTTFTNLLRTGKESYTREWDEIVEQGGGFMGPRTQLKTDLERKEPEMFGDNPGEIVTAAQIKGPKADSKPVNVVFITDLDMISKPFFDIRDQQFENLDFDNIAFVLNAVDVLAGVDTLVPLRIRRGQHRTLKRVENKRREVERKEIEDRTRAEDKAKKKNEEATQNFVEMANKIREDKSLDRQQQEIKLAQLAENQTRQMAVIEAQIKDETNQEIRVSRDRTQAEILRLESQFRWASVLLIPLPAILLGLVVLSVRMADENRAAVPERLLKKHK